MRLTRINRIVSPRLATSTHKNVIEFRRRLIMRKFENKKRNIHKTLSPVLFFSYEMYGVDEQTFSRHYLSVTQ